MKMVWRWGSEKKVKKNKNKKEWEKKVEDRCQEKKKRES
jgi:hypothetical protein